MDDRSIPLRPIGEIAENLDAMRRPVKASERQPGPYPYYGAQGVVDHVSGYLFDGEFVLVAEDGENLRSRNEAIALIARGRFWVNNHAHILRGTKEADTRYLYYAINAADISGYVTGSTIPKLSQGNLNRLHIPCPRIDEQRAVVSILGTLDDKIELNRRMNETLEAMARAIFKDWFVDFGPTRAKMEGRAPYLAPEIWALFPERMDDEGKPEGWSYGSLGTIVDQRIERVGPSSETAALPYVPIECISSRSLALLESKPGADAQSSLTTFYAGDILFGAMRPYFHKVCIAPFNGTTRTTAFVLKSRRPDDFSFACLQLHDENTIDYATRHSSGSTIPYAKWTGSLEEMPILIPPVPVRNAFDVCVRAILEKLSKTYFENCALSATRDLLLPKLMSGEIRLKDAEKIAEAAA